MNNPVPLSSPPFTAMSTLSGKQNILLSQNHKQNNSINSNSSVLVNHKLFRPGFIRKPNSSGSETDISTSNENLTPEEQYFLTKGIRQDPQGEETLFDSNSNSDSNSSNNLTNNLSKSNNNNGNIDNLLPSSVSVSNVSSSAALLANNDNGSLKYNFNYVSPYLYHHKYSSHLINDSSSPLSQSSSTSSQVQKVQSRKPPTTSFLPKALSSNDNNYYYANSPLLPDCNHNKTKQITIMSSTSGIGTGRNIVHNKPQMLLKMPIQIESDNTNHYSNLHSIKFANQLDDTVIAFPTSTSGQASSSSLHSTSGMISRKPLDSLQIPQSSPTPPPPPAYGSQLSRSGSKLLDRLTISRSHPDLSKFPDEELSTNSVVINGNNTNILQNSLSSVSGLVNRNNPAFLSTVNENSYSQNAFYRANYTVDMLINENTALRTKLDDYVNKVKRLQNVEIEIQKVHQSHEELMRSSEKKEKLEKALRYKLEMQVHQLNEECNNLKGQLEKNPSYEIEAKYESHVEDLKKEINRRDVLISQLLTQDKDYKGDKERQEIELQAQRLTLQEQRNHIEILDTALINAQNNIIALESEIEKKNELEEKAHFLKNSLQNLHLTNERRIQMEKRARLQLEKEIIELKRNLDGNSSDKDNSCINSTNSGNSDIDSLKKTMREYEEKIFSLEAEVSKWEQKYLEESTLRSIEVSAASAAPKDVKIAALVWNSHENKKLIAEARNLKHMDEIHQANKKFTELESKVKNIESKLVEKDAMIKVLQKHSEDRQAAVLQHTLVRRFPNHHSRSASTMGLVANASTSTLPKAKVSDLSNELSNLIITGNGNAAQRSISSTNNISTISLSDSSKDKLLPAASGSDSDWSGKIDSRTSTKDSSSSSIIQALKNEKERFPNHYNDWRL